MTCKQMGGPCDAAFSGNTADEVMNGGSMHLEEMASQGDVEHQKAKAMMDEGQKNPDLGKQWYDKFVQDFAALPEDN